MKILFVRSAERELLRLNRTLGKRIIRQIGLLKNNPYSLNSQKLEGGNGYRVRVGNYRIIYTVNKLNKTVLIIKIGHRREIYR
ncbi:MAG: hypothetical protein A2W22_04415 [Candidatus Levybacteria bacterium RBG_16_35_11]|nr:MAG: hypothetical protein A2W22_04415 [Candidatus Levybacteria bacterium RBG_16_35_11]